MPHLVEKYALETGLRIDKMLTYQQFFPLPDGFEKYILVCTGSGMASKNYSYFSDVLWMLKEPLIKAGYKFIQVGGKDDEKIGTHLDLCGVTTTHQYFYLVQHASLVICNDSSILHLAGHFNVPVVTLFGITDPQISGAYFGPKDIQIHLTPDFGSSYPSFDPNERPKRIDKIRPETVADAALKLLKLKGDTVESLFIGEQYRFQALEVVPDHIIDPNFFTKNLLNLRLDFGGKEEIVYAYLSQRKCNVITNRPLDINILTQLRPNIQTVVYELTENHDPKFAEALHRSGIPYLLLSYMSPADLDKIKLDYFEFNLIHPKERKTRAVIPNLDRVGNATHFRCNKYVLSQGKIYLSRAHFEASVPTPNFEQNVAPIIDNETFWGEAEFFYLFNKKGLK